jgi:hypothetical protein
MATSVNGSLRTIDTIFTNSRRALSDLGNTLETSSQPPGVGRAPAADTCMRITLGCKQIHAGLGRVGTSRWSAPNAGPSPGLISLTPPNGRAHVDAGTLHVGMRSPGEIAGRGTRSRNSGSLYLRDIRSSRSVTYPCRRLTQRGARIRNRPNEGNPSRPLLPTINTFVCGYPNHPVCPAWLVCPVGRHATPRAVWCWRTSQTRRATGYSLTRWYRPWRALCRS